MSPEPIGDAARALAYWERRQEAVSNDLANVSTPGYRGARVFARLLEGDEIEVATSTDSTPGALEETGRPLDLAIEGEGFLLVDTPQGVRYTRDGSLSVGRERRLLGRGGHPVVGEDGPIVLPEGAIEIREDGAILVDGREEARIRVEVPTRADALIREGGSLLRPEARGRSLEPDEVRLRIGHLEGSNVDPVSGMVRMIEVQRAYESVLRTVQVLDGVNETIAARLGRVE